MVSNTGSTSKVSNKANYVKVILTDDHHIVRHAIRTILETDSRYNIVAEADNAEDAIDLIKQNNPDILILDIGLRNRSGLDLITQVKEIAPNTKVIVLTMYEEEQKVKQALNNGAKGYIIKDSQPREILDAIEKVSAGENFLPKKFEHLSASDKQPIKAAGKKRRDPNDPLSALSPREREMFFYLAEGLPNRQIATKLFISARTVETHRSRVIKKLSLRSNADLIRYAFRHGLITA